MSTTVFLEGDTPTWSGTLTDNSGSVIPGTSLDSLTLTLFYKESDGTVTVINARDAQDILGGSKTGANDVTVSAGGVMEWSLQTADTTAVSAVPETPAAFAYTARIVANYDSDRQYTTEFPITIRRLADV